MWFVLNVSHRQYGFKNGLDCNNAVFVLQNVIKYFNDRGSNVYLASLDASKAFHHVNNFSSNLNLFNLMPNT